MSRRSEFFARPEGVPMRRYEALRAYEHEGASIQEAAEIGGYTPGFFRNLLTSFRKNRSALFFWPEPRKAAPTDKSPNPRPARILALRREENISIQEIQVILKQEGIPASLGYIQKIFKQHRIPRLARRSADERSPRVIPADRTKLDLSERTFSTDFAGLFLFAFDLAQMDLKNMLEQVKMHGTKRVPAVCAMLSLLALKLYGIGRPSQVMAESLDEGLALFTGLNAIPKCTTLTEYSILVDPAFAGPLMHRWDHAAANIANVVGRGNSIDLDFHTIPYHGDQALLEKHFVSNRSRRQRGILTVLARDADSNVFCYAAPTVRKETRNDAVLAFVKDWEARTGTVPEELVFDSRFTIYANLATLNQMEIPFITLRRRHTSLIQRVHSLDKSAWTNIRLDNIGRRYRTPGVVDETVHLRDYPHPIRQLLVRNLGHDKPAVLITNQMKRDPGELIERYARRMVRENVISDAINFFHMDALSSVVPMRINVDVQLTVMVSVLYRLLGTRVGKPYANAGERTIFRDLAKRPGKVTITKDEIVVQFRARANDNYLIAAGYSELRQKIPWLDHKILRMQFGERP